MLNGKQKRYLRGEGSLLNPSVVIGKEGLSAEVINEINRNILNIELIKVKVLKTAPEDLKEISKVVCERFRCEEVQTIGRVILFFKEKAKESNFKLPK